MKYLNLITTLTSAFLMTQTATNAQESSFSPKLTAPEILKVSNAVADWQLDNPSKHPDTDWTSGTLYTGIITHAHTTGDARYADYLRAMSKKNNYQLGPRAGFGDDHIVGRAHIWQYMQDELPQQLAPTEAILKNFISRPHDESLLWVNQIHLREWAWCDSLYMAPPTLAMLYSATGEEKYLEKMDELWWKTTDYLYDKESHLFWRDSNYFDLKEKNGEKVFWSRGNGWVIAGLCQILQHMPEDYPTRPKYVKLFKEMAVKLKTIQCEDGSWHAALLDSKTYKSPESSGTAFFTYAFTWGVNQGLLDEKEFMPSVNKAWNRLVKNVHVDGKLGFVQAIGKDPQSVTMEETDVYGVGGFLMAAHELHKYITVAGSTNHDITVKNPGSNLRLNNVIELDWKQAQAKLAGLTAENVAIQDRKTGLFIPVQIFDKDMDGTAETLLTQVNLGPKESLTLRVYKLKNAQPAFQPSRLHLRYVPERSDDFAWENDRMAFRMYGPKLAIEGVGGGVDVWTKRVRSLVVDQWYKDGPEGPNCYHVDKGEGMDAYKVGHTLGAGGLGFLNPKDELVIGPVYKTWKVIDKGPLRLRFQLTYAPVEIGQGKVTETRTIWMNAGSHFFSTKSEFKNEGDLTGVRPATGLYVHDPEKLKMKGFEDDQIIMQTSHALALWETLGDAKDKYGNIGTSIVLPKGGITSIHRHNVYLSDTTLRDKKHVIVPLAKSLDAPVEWQVGTTWQGVDCDDETEFRRRVYKHVHQSILKPIEVKF